MLVHTFGTVRGRAGLTVLPTLVLYGTGGFAYANVSRNGGGYTTSMTQTGWTAGGGAEWMFLPNWSAKAEYLYTDVSGGNTNSYGGNWGIGLNNVNNHTRYNTVRAGVNYHFNWGAAPVAAKY
jgi:outer membrane immunogenic protein